MNKFLEELIELNRIDRKLEELEPIEKSIKAPLIKLENQKKSLQTKLEKLEEEIKNIKLKRGKNELIISELKDKLNQIEMKKAKIKTDKEFKALQIEEELAKEQIEVANEEINKFEKLIEQKEEEKKELQKEIEKIEADITLTTEEINEKLKTIEAQKEELFKSKEKLIKEMNPKIYSFYEKIKRWAGTSAVVPVKRHACSGCNMVINDKIFSEVLKAEEIITCPHCGRVLFIEEEDNINEK